MPPGQPPVAVAANRAKQAMTGVQDSRRKALLARSGGGQVKDARNQALQRRQADEDRTKSLISQRTLAPQKNPSDPREMIKRMASKRLGM